MSVRQRLVSVADRVQRTQLWVAVTALVILMMVTVVDVLMRYLFTRPIRASLETVEVMLMVFVFNGMAAAFFYRRHIVIDLLDNVFGPRLTRMLVRAGDILSVICLLLLVWAMLQPATQAYHYGDAKMELPLTIFALWVVALGSMVGTIFCALVTMVARPPLLEAGHGE